MRYATSFVSFQNSPGVARCCLCAFQSRAPSVCVRFSLERCLFVCDSTSEVGPGRLPPASQTLTRNESRETNNGHFKPPRPDDQTPSPIRSLARRRLQNASRCEMAADVGACSSPPSWLRGGCWVVLQPLPLRGALERGAVMRVCGAGVDGWTVRARPHKGSGTFPQWSESSHQPASHLQTAGK